MKKIVAVLLIGILLTLLLSGAFSVAAGNLEEKIYGDFTYTVEGQAVSIVNVHPKVSGDVVVPSTIEGRPVVSIGDRAFDGCGEAVTITIPASVKAIGETAFEECTNLTAFIVAFGNKAFCAREGVLYNRSRTKLLCYPPAKENLAFSIPDGVTHVDIVAFGWAANLERVVVADGVEKLGERAFCDSTALKQVTFGTDLKEIGVEAFAGCTALESVVIPNSVTKVGRAAFSNCSAMETITFGRGMAEIGGTMFLNCTSLKTVAIPDNVKNIVASAFAGCSQLETITIPGQVTGIGAYAFYKCDNLKTVLYTGSETDKSEIAIGAKNELLSAAEWHFNAESAEPSSADISVGPQPISGPDSNVVWAWVMIGGVVVLLTAAIIVLIVVLVKGIKART